MSRTNLISVSDEEAAVRELEESGRYRIYRRVDLSRCLLPRAALPTRKAVFVDIESTGLDVGQSELIEIGILPFEYQIDGTIVAIGEPQSYLNEPDSPISTKITQLTGITNEMVKGHRLDPEILTSILDEAAVVIAHNAAFDRPMAERYCAKFSVMPWVCSMTDIDWNREGLTSRRLSDLLAAYKLFFDAHRAIDDCEAGVALLAQKANSSNECLLSLALENARQATWRVFAMGVPYSNRTTFVDRGYRWNADTTFGPKGWWIELREEALNSEREFMEAQLLCNSVQLDVRRLSALDRFTARYSERSDIFPEHATPLLPLP
ncbi:3'-5' exonuclease [Devosia sp. MC532]|uniref:3'-5' exonuclease n=1 Tax=Devosia sp. MC532 TaxID=2799788 RepID=UPI0018F36D0D|nr:3'-5' exonuclease [Devosia sp. MC532]MBJ7577470.1 3'-5' exonuclease [Devosia sp. MC532]